MKREMFCLSQGELHKKDDSLEFEMVSGEKFSIPIVQISIIYMLSSVKISVDCLKLLGKYGITVHYFDRYEYYVGTFLPKNTGNLNGDLLIKQVLAFTDINERIKLSKIIIKACFKNMRRNIKYYSNRNDFEMTEIENVFENNINKLECASSINEIMLIEASMHKIYYSFWNKILIFEKFTSRVQSGAMDIVNILITFINSLIYSLIVSEIYKTGLTPTISFLHEPSQSRLSLSFDIAEIFRPLLVDRLVFFLINKKIVSQSDVGENGLLTDEAVKKILYHWDKQINTTFYHRKLKRHITYRYLIREELYKLIRYLNNEEEYSGFVIWW